MTGRESEGKYKDYCSWISGSAVQHAIIINRATAALLKSVPRHNNTDRRETPLDLASANQPPISGLGVSMYPN